MSTMQPGGTHREPPGTPSPYGCPKCGGVLWELDEEGDIRFRCRIGHAFTGRSLAAAEEAQLEDALWAAVRALEEQESMARRMLDRPWGRGSERAQERVRQRVEDARRRADVLRELLLTPVGGNGPDEGLGLTDQPGEAAPRDAAAREAAAGDGAPA
jgi:two-component system chemotaxis response regulator CheB